MKEKSLVEMMIHVPLCTHANSDNILYVGEKSSVLENEFAKYKSNVDFVSDATSMASKNEKIYDVVIFNDFVIDKFFLANLEKILKNDGVFVFKSSLPVKDLDRLKSDLLLVGTKFWIAMPYSFGHNCLILASKKFHPTADIVLQRSDLLDDLEYYSSEIHNASFVFPAKYHKALTNYAKR